MFCLGRGGGGAGLQLGSLCFLYVIVKQYKLHKYLRTLYLIITKLISDISDSRLVLLKLKFWISYGDEMTENELVKDK